jgi:hypothetical protein
MMAPEEINLHLNVLEKMIYAELDWLYSNGKVSLVDFDKMMEDVEGPIDQLRAAYNKYARVYAVARSKQ